MRNELLAAAVALVGDLKFEANNGAIGPNRETLARSADLNGILHTLRYAGYVGVRQRMIPPDRQTPLEGPAISARQCDLDAALDADRTGTLGWRSRTR